MLGKEEARESVERQLGDEKTNLTKNSFIRGAWASPLSISFLVLAPVMNSGF